MIPTNLKPGDILFFRENPKFFGSRLVAWLQKTFKESAGLPKEAVYTHVGMVSTELDLIIEMHWPEPSFTKINELDWVNGIDVKRPLCSDEIMRNAVRWCYLHMGYNYRWSDYLLAKLGLTYAKRVCSGWINQAYLDSDYTIIDPKDHLPSPCDMAVSDKLAPIPQA